MRKVSKILKKGDEACKVTGRYCHFFGFASLFSGKENENLVKRKVREYHMYKCF